MPTNPFRNRAMRAAYEEAARAHAAGAALLFARDGGPNRGNGVAGPFWRGFEGRQAGMWDAASRRTLAYAYWRAGRDVAAAAMRGVG